MIMRQPHFITLQYVILLFSIGFIWEVSCFIPIRSKQREYGRHIAPIKRDVQSKKEARPSMNKPRTGTLLIDTENNSTILGLSDQGGDFRTGLAHNSKHQAICNMENYCYTPYYPSVADVKNNEDLQPQQQEEEMRSFFNIAKYWSIAEILDTLSPLFPQWILTATTQQAQNPDGDKPGFAVGGKAKHFVSIDHLYEIKLLDQFFSYLVTDIGVSCDTLKDYFDQPGQFGNTRLTDFYRNLPRYANPEFVGMDDRINQAKAKIWDKGGANSNTSPMNIRGGPGVSAIDHNKDQLATFAISLQLLNDYRVRSIFQMTNARVYQALSAIKQQWGDLYRSWMTAKIQERNQVLQAVAIRVIGSIPTNNQHPSAAMYPNEVPRWSSFMSSLLASHPVISMTIPAVGQWAVVAEATGSTTATINPTDAAQDIDAGNSLSQDYGKNAHLRSGVNTQQSPTITAATR